MKKNRIIDIVFMGNNDLLDFRLSELDEYVDHFFLINHNNSNYETINKKVKIIKSEKIDLIDFSPQEQLNHVVDECLKQLDTKLEDIIVVSNYNEIPDFEFVDEMMQELSFNPIFLEHKVFNWSLQYTQEKRKKGSYVFDFSYYLRSNGDLKNLMKYKKEEYLTINNFKNGWCFLGFDYENHDKELYENRKPFDFINPFISKQLIKTKNEKLPKNYHLLGFNNLDRTYSKKFVFSDKKEIQNLECGYFVYLNFVDKYTDLKINEVTRNNILVTSYIPKFTLYGDEKNFVYNFKINEIKKIINYFFILDQDIIEIYLDTKFFKSSWGLVKDKIFSEIFL